MNNEHTLHHWRKLLLPCEGAQAILWSGGWGIYHLHVKQIEIAEFGLLAEGKPIPTAGLVGDARLYTRPVCARWEDFEYAQGNWANRKLKWTLFFESDIQSDVFKIVAKLPPGKNFVDDTFLAPLPLGAPLPKFRRNIPGPVFLELVDYLNKSELRLFGWPNDPVHDKGR
jgi:hypothetical protein